MIPTIPIFTPPTTDTSIIYLGKIFGSMSGLLPSGGAVNILGNMFKTFNVIILTIAALVLVYTTVVGVMQTAHEGEFMGKKWNNIWIPIRSVLGIVLMVPTSTGYSILQIVMMWVIIQGVGAADLMWNNATISAETMGSVYAQGTIPTADVSQSFRGLFSGLVCDASARVNKADPSDSAGGGYFCANSSSGGFCGSTLNFNKNVHVLELGPGGSCGSLTFCDASTSVKCQDPQSLDCLACQGLGDGLAQVIPTLAGIAKSVVAADYSFREFYYKSGSSNNYPWIRSYCSANGISQSDCCIKSDAPGSTCKVGASFPDPNASKQVQNASNAAMKMYWGYWDDLGPNLGVNTNILDLGTKLLQTSLDAIYSNYIAGKAAENKNSSGAFAPSREKGWITAGAYYWDLANLNQEAYHAVIPELQWSVPQDFATGTMSKFRNNFSAAESLMGAASNNSTPTDDVTSAIGTAGQAFKDSLNQKNTNPLLSLQIAGAGLLIAAQVMITVIAALVTALGIFGFITVMFLGTGVTNPVGPAGQFLLLFFLPAIYAIVGYLIVIGGILAVYIPLIPYVVFTFGVIGWFISVIETMVAGPFVALGIISPSGQHELLGKSEPALMLLFNVFIRPALMIFGLIAAMLLSMVVMEMINSLFWPIVYQQVGKSAGLLTMLMMVGAYAMLVLAALNKTFSAINVIPQQVMRWISGSGEQVDTPLDQIKGGVSKMGGETQRGSQGLQSASDKGSPMIDKQAKINKKTQDDSKMSGGS